MLKNSLKVILGFGLVPFSICIFIMFPSLFIWFISLVMISVVVWVVVALSLIVVAHGFGIDTDDNFLKKSLEKITPIDED